MMECFLCGGIWTDAGRFLAHLAPSHSLTLEQFIRDDRFNKVINSEIEFFFGSVDKTVVCFQLPESVRQSLSTEKCGLCEITLASSDIVNHIKEKHQDTELEVRKVDLL